MSEISDSEARDLFGANDQAEDSNPFNDKEQISEKHEKSQHNPKRSKKHKEEKHSRKRRHVEEDDQDDEMDEGMRGMFEDEASEISDEEDEDDYGDDDIDAGERRRFEEDIYNKKGPKADEDFYNRIKGKSEKEIREMYKRKLHQRRENEVLVPSSDDHKTYSVSVKIGKEDDVVFSILKKMQHFQKTQNAKFRVAVTSAMAMKKKYPGKIFVEASGESAIRESFSGLIDVNLGKISALEHEDYTNLFVVKEAEQPQFKKGDFIRIKKGVYEDDLGRIAKLNKSSADVILVPRINIQELSIKIKEQCSKISDEKLIRERKEELLKKYLNPRTFYPSHLRPSKKLFENDNPFIEFADIPLVQRIKLQSGGLINLNFRLEELKKLKGSILPIEAQPFAQDGRVFDEMRDERVVTGVSFSKGEEAEIVAGELMGLFGIVEEIKPSTAVIKCRTKGMEGRVLEEPLEHLAKRFKEGQRVKVTSGTDKGKTGLILRLEGRHAEIWTDNENTIRINKNNLEVHMGEVISEENLHGLKKDDLIKTTKNAVGIVLSTTKDNIKILDTHNTLRIISNLDFDSKVNSALLLTKNKNNEQIRNNSIVRVRQGQFEGLRCIVKHVYKDFVFMFNESLDKTSGITVQKADNCAVLAKTTQGNPNRRFNPSNNQQKPSNSGGFSARDMGGSDHPNEDEEKFKVGKSIVISVGPLKGYRGIIKSVNKDRIEVRVPQKSCTEWITKGNLVTGSRDHTDMGKTPKRMGMSTYQQPAMSPYH